MKFRRKHSIGRYLVFWPCLAGGLFFTLLSPYAAFLLWRDGEGGALILCLGWVAAAIFLAFAAIFLRSGRRHHVYRVSKKHADGTLTLRPVPKHSDDSSEEPNVTLTLSHSPLCLGQRFTVKLGGDAASVIGDRPARLLLRCHERVEVGAPVSQRTWKYDNIFYEDAKELPDQASLAAAVDFRIPTNVMPTFHATDAHATWRFHLTAPAGDGRSALDLKLPTIPVESRVAQDAEFDIPAAEATGDFADTIRIELQPGPLGPDHPRAFPLGSTVRGRLTVEPRRRRRAKRLSIELAWTANGDCQTNDRVVRTWQEKEIPELPDGSRFEREFEFDIPPNAPITHAGHLFRIDWHVQARTWGNWLTGTMSAAASIVVTPTCDPDGRPPFKRGTPAVRPTGS